MAVNKAQAELMSVHTKHSIDLLRLSEDLNRRLQPHLTRLQRELIAEIASKDLSKWRRQRLESLLTFANSEIPKTYRTMDAETGMFNSGIAEYEQEFTFSNVKSATGIEIGASLTVEQLNAIVSDTLIQGAPSKDWWSRQSVQLQNRFSDEMRQGFLRGEGSADLARRVRQIMPVSRRNAEALARTSVQAVSGEVREQLIADNDDVLNGYIHVSTLDARTTLICISRDNLKWNQDKEPVGHSKQFRRPPLHWNCRSTLVPWVKSWKELGAKYQGEVPEGTRSSMNGSVPRGLSYPEWLKTQTKATQLEVLGRKRWELWNQGEGPLSLRQLTAQNGRALTLEQIRSR